MSPNKTTLHRQDCQSTMLNMQNSYYSTAKQALKITTDLYLQFSALSLQFIETKTGIKMRRTITSTSLDGPHQQNRRKGISRVWCKRVNLISFLPLLFQLGVFYLQPQGEVLICWSPLLPWSTEKSSCNCVLKAEKHL